jgi:membrane protease YdiL (CAAX protease family)
VRERLRKWFGKISASKKSYFEKHRTLGGILEFGGLFMFLIVTLFVVLILAVEIFYLFFEKKFPGIVFSREEWLLNIVAGVEIIILLFYQKFLRKKNLSQIGIKNPLADWKNIIIGVLFAISYSFLINYAYLYGTPWTSPWNYELHVDILRKNLIWYWSFMQLKGFNFARLHLGIVLGELIFRGFLQTKAMDSFGKWKGLILVSLIFTFAHFTYSAESMLQILPLSLMLGFLYSRKRNLTSPLITHLLFNFLLMRG